MQAIPANNLRYPVLVNLHGSTASGFHLNAPEASYFVTAKHVLYDGNQLRGQFVTLRSYSNVLTEYSPIDLRIDLEVATIKYHPEADVVLIKVQDTDTDNPNVAPGITVQRPSVGD